MTSMRHDGATAGQKGCVGNEAFDVHVVGLRPELRWIISRCDDERDRLVATLLRSGASAAEDLLGDVNLRIADVDRET